MIELKKELTEILFKTSAGKHLSKDEILELIELPPDSSFGDLAFPCFKLSKALKLKPVEISEKLKKEVKLTESFVKSQVKGSYLNFYFNYAKLSEKLLKKVLEETTLFGKNFVGKGKTVMVEYSSPNTNKPLHFGHLRNHAIGMSVIRLLEFSGYKVVKAVLYNDRGVGVSKAMLGFELSGKTEPDKKSDHFVGNCYVLFSKRAKENLELEVKAKELVVKWEQGDKKTLELWNKINDWAVKGIKETDELFGSEFDVVFKESDYWNKAEELLVKGREKGVVVDSEGAVILDLEKFNLGKTVVKKSDGATLYVTCDLALTPDKFKEFNLDKNVWVVASEQNLYFNQLFKFFELLGFNWVSKCRHLSYGLVFLPGGRMKSREGKTADADNIIQELISLAVEQIKEKHSEVKGEELKKRSKAIALSAIKFFLLKVENNKSITFTPKESLSFEGETGPYVLYSFARIKSILRKAGKVEGKPDFKMLSEPLEKKLISLLLKFDEIVLSSAENLSPNSLCHYLLDLASTFNSFYHEFPVLKAEQGLMQARLQLIQAVSIVLENGLKLLNIETLEEM
ncbi:MAG: arginine--tRNA ligase [archaeon]